MINWLEEGRNSYEDAIVEDMNCPFCLSPLIVITVDSNYYVLRCAQYPHFLRKFEINYLSPQFPEWGYADS